MALGRWKQDDQEVKVILRYSRKFDASLDKITLSQKQNNTNRNLRSLPCEPRGRGAGARSSVRSPEVILSNLG